VSARGRRLRRVCAALALPALGCAAAPQPAPAAAPFRVIAHRGASAYAPENTLPAFERALALGASEVELDVQLSRDGEIVLFHDATLDEKTDLAGAVRDHDAAALLRADIGSWFDATHPQGGARYRGTSLLRLEDLLARFGPRFHYHVEMKSQEPELPAALIDLLRRDAVDLLPQVTLTSFHLALLQRAHALDPRVARAWLVLTPPEASDDDARHAARRELVERAAREGFGSIAFPARELDAELVGQAHARGLEIRAWKTTTEALLDHALRVGADGATVDWPDRALRRIRERSGGSAASAR